MAKKGMKRPDNSENISTESNHKNKYPKNDMTPVPEIQGNARSGHNKANDQYINYFDENK